MEIKPKINNNFVQYAANPRAFTLKKWLSQILQSRFPKHEQIVERISSSLITDKDLEDFGILIGDVYEVAYMKAVEEYRVQFEKMGINVVIDKEVKTT